MQPPLPHPSAGDPKIRHPDTSRNKSCKNPDASLTSKCASGWKHSHHSYLIPASGDNAGYRGLSGTYLTRVQRWGSGQTAVPTPPALLLPLQHRSARRRRRRRGGVWRHRSFNQSGDAPPHTYPQKVYNERLINDKNKRREWAWTPPRPSYSVRDRSDESQRDCQSSGVERASCCSEGNWALFTPTCIYRLIFTIQNLI